MGEVCSERQGCATRAEIGRINLALGFSSHSTSSTAIGWKMVCLILARGAWEMRTTKEILPWFRAKPSTISWSSRCRSAWKMSISSWIIIFFFVYHPQKGIFFSPDKVTLKSWFGRKSQRKRGDLGRKSTKTRKNRRKTKKNQRKTWWFQKKSLPLHRNRETTAHYKMRRWPKRTVPSSIG